MGAFEYPKTNSRNGNKEQQKTKAHLCARRTCECILTIHEHREEKATSLNFVDRGNNFIGSSLIYLNNQHAPSASS